LNNLTEKYCGSPYQTWWKWTKTAKPTERNKKKKRCASMEIADFDRHTPLFNGDSMGAIS
jgi:hypothetical protein